MEGKDMNEFETLYYKNAYLTDFSSTVVDCIKQGENGSDCSIIVVSKSNSVNRPCRRIFTLI